MPESTASYPDEPARAQLPNLLRIPWRWLGEVLVTVFQGLPLYRREMLVQSYRLRTYAIRAAFASILFLVALIYASIATGTPLIGAAVRLPGQGKVILDALIWMLFVFIYVYGPATASGAITLEKERQTLELLYLTKLTPWHIILEKFLSRLLPLLGIVLLAVPLLVFAYVFGGVSPEMLGTAVWFLFVTSVQVTAFSVLSSTLCQRTTQAFVLTFLLLLLLYFGPTLVEIWVDSGQFSTSKRWNQSTVQQQQLLQNALLVPNTMNPLLTPGAPNPAIPEEYLLLACFPPALFNTHYEPAILGGRFQWKPMFMAGVPALVSAFCALVLARMLLFYRAFAENRFNVFRRLHGFTRRFSTVKQAATAAKPGRPIILKDIPHEHPIAWRESTKGTGNWLPLLLLLEVPALVMVLWLARTSNGDSAPIAVEIVVLWVVSVLLICVNSSSLINKERNQQTLELLLVTPLSSTDIIQQKFNGTRRLMLICAAPLLSCIAFQAWWRSTVYRPLLPTEKPFVWWDYAITETMCVVIYFQLIGWIALWSGLKNKSPTRATLDSLGGVLALCCVPPFVLALPFLGLAPIRFLDGVNFLAVLGAQLSPVVMIGLAEFTNLREICNVPLLPSIANTLVYGSMLWWARRYVMERADVLLGRTVHY